MLSIEKRQALTSLLLLGEIKSVTVNDYDYGSGLSSAVTIHAKSDVDRQDILDFLYNTIGAIAEDRAPHDPDGEQQVFPYTLYIEGASSILSTLFFTETVKEKPSAPTEDQIGINTLYSTTNESIAEMAEREA